MKLITELNEDIEYITEGTGSSKKLYIQGIYMQAGIKNKNGRIYSPEVMENAVGRYIAEKVNKNMAYGELNHPATPKIDLERVCHRIVEMKRVGNNWHGKSLVLETPTGKIVRGLLDGGSNVAVSSRGMGSLVQTNEGTMVGEDFRLSTAADVVSDPSAPDAFVNGIMEGVEWVYDPVNQSYQAEQVVESVKKTLDANRNGLSAADRMKAFQMFVEHVKNVEFKP